MVGSSRYAQALRRAIREAAADPERRPVLISGEPGLEKDNPAALIHFGSPARRQLLVRLNGALLQPDGAELFAAGPDSPALLEALGEGALLLDQIDRADPALQERLRQLVATGRWSDPKGGEHRFAGRFFLTTETVLTGFDALGLQIRVPHLRELSGLIDRALRQCDQERPAVLPEEVFWTERRPQSARFDLWRWKPQLREWMRSPRFWSTLLFGLVSWLFVLVNLWLWRGPQDRVHNGALLLFWALMLAHTLPLGMGEGGRLLAVSLAPLGAPALGVWSADPHVVAFCQSLVTAVGVVGSAVLLRRLLQPDLGRWLLLSGACSGEVCSRRFLVRSWASPRRLPRRIRSSPRLSRQARQPGASAAAGGSCSRARREQQSSWVARSRHRR